VTNALMRRYDADLARIAGEVGSQRLAEAWNAGAAVPWAEMLAELGTAGAAWQPPHQAVAPTVSSIQS
jgi:hypothetical protein